MYFIFKSCILEIGFQVFPSLQGTGQVENLEFLSVFSFGVNFVAYVVTIWLGLFIITRSSRNAISWLTSLALWSTSGFFLNSLLAIYPPPLPTSSPFWLKLLFPFWSPDVFETGWSGWAAGWNVTPAIAFWHHATILIRNKKPGWKLNLQAALVYGVSIFTIYTQVSTTNFFASATGDPLNLDSLSPGPLYPVLMVFLVLFFLMCLINLVIAGKSAVNSITSNQMRILTLATAIAGVTSLTAFTLVLPMIGSIPRVINSIFLLVSVFLLGYGVARYSAFIEGRAIRRDFRYNAVIIGVIVLIYSGATWISVSLFNIPAIAFVIVMTLAVLTHALIDYSRHHLEFFLYRREERVWRENLRKMANTGADENLEEILKFIFSSLGESVRAQFGLIIVFDGDKADTIQTYRMQRDVQLSRERLLADDLLALNSDHFSPELEDAALLVPLYRQSDQIGAVILGCPINGIQYSEIDIVRILKSTDQIADSINSVQQELDHLSRAVNISHERRVIHGSPPEKVPTEIVEKVLRNISDYAFLGDSELTALNLVQRRIPETSVTHIDRGKAVYEVVEQAVEKLRPDIECETTPPPREWYPYYILHWAYFEDKLNREIMAELYISEGTFNRTRRSALRSLARVIGEMETAGL